MAVCNIQILQGGLFTTIQDVGRNGHLNDGIPRSGAMDQTSMALANWLAHQHMHAPVFEMTQTGMSFSVDKALTIGIAGGEAEVHINEAKIDPYKTIHLNENDQVSIGLIKSGMCLYLSFGGILKQEKVLGSFATYTRALVGSNNGQKFIKGDHVIVETEAISNKVRILKESWRPKWNQNIIRICKGPEWSLLTDEQQNLLLQTSFRISSQSDRMGIRLKGPKFSINAQMISCAVSIGVIQLPPGSEPIIIMNDGQSTGGYPRIAFVSQIDLRILAQKRPEAIIRFRIIDSEDSYNLMMHEQKRLAYLFSEIDVND